MALRTLVRKMPAGHLVGLVHAPSPAAASRRMLSHARPVKKYQDPDPRVNEILELMDRKHEMHKKAFYEGKEAVRKGGEKLDKDTKALAYGMYGLSAYLVLSANYEVMMHCAERDA